jgi:hypothetical protein
MCKECGYIDYMHGTRCPDHDQPPATKDGNMTCKCEEYRNMLEDVVNELDLSDGMIEQHGPMGTAPATLVRLVLARKDQEIAMLKAGMKCIEINPTAP